MRVGHGLELGAHIKAVAFRVAMGDACAQQQAERLGHQHQLDRQMGAGCQRCGVLKVDTAFGNDHRLRGADFTQQAAGHDLAEQIQAFVLHFEEGCEAAIFLIYLAQQVLGFEFAEMQFAEMQFAEQIEEWGIIQQHFLARRFRGRQCADLKCDHVVDTVVFAAFFFI